MKKLVLHLLFFFSLCQCFAQSAYIDPKASSSSSKKYHNDSICPYFLDNNAVPKEIDFEKVDRFVYKECPYCYANVPYDKCNKLYIAEYKSEFYELNLNKKTIDTLSGDCSRFEQKVFGGKLLVGVFHEELNESKRRNIVDSHVNSNLSNVLSIASIGQAVLTNQWHWASILSHRAALDLEYSNGLTKTAESLDIVISFSNISEDEITFNDENRGSVWHLLPGETIRFSSFDIFDGKYRVEFSSPGVKDVSFLYFNTTNYVLKVRPTLIDKEFIYFPNPPQEAFVKHYIDVDDYKKQATPYRMSRKDHHIEMIK